MIGDFGNRNSTKQNYEPAEFSPDNWKDCPLAREAMAKKVIEHVGGKVEPHRILILVDLNGIYMRLHEWLTAAGMPIRGGLVLSRFAFFQIQDAFARIKKEIIDNSDGRVADFEDVMESILTSGSESISIDPKKTYLDFRPQFDLFYAPAPHRDIAWKLRKEARAGGVNLQRLVKMAEKGVIELFGKERDYDAYDDFIAKLKANPEYSKSEQGFFCYNVGPKGIRYFGEKEVDTRIVMRTMDVLYNYEADAVCVVSSDQDFLPLCAKSSEFGVTFYQADLAKFEMTNNTGRKIRDLGDKFLPGRINPEWPLKIICEASASDEWKVNALYTIDEGELISLCKMHNEMNAFHIAPNYKADGDVSGLTISKPIPS